MMKDEKNKEPEEKETKKKKKEANPVPFCTTAPSAEHARGELEDDPCDDYREGD
jgi:hypothetical protein